MQDKKVNDRTEKTEEEELASCKLCQDEVPNNSNPPDLCDSCAWNIFNEEDPEGFDEN